MNINQSLKEALKIAEIFEDANRAKYPYYLDAAATIRKLVADNETLTKDLIGASLYEHDYKTLMEKQKRLSDEETMKEWEKTHRIGGVK